MYNVRLIELRESCSTPPASRGGRASRTCRLRVALGVAGNRPETALLAYTANITPYKLSLCSLQLRQKITEAGSSSLFGNRVAEASRVL